MTRRIGVLGAGSWGTTLADLLARGGHQVTLWAYEAEVVEQNGLVVGRLRDAAFADVEAGFGW